MYDRCTFDRRYPQDQIYNKRKLVPTWGTFGDIYTNSVSRMSILFVFFFCCFPCFIPVSVSGIFVLVLMGHHARVGPGGTPNVRTWTGLTSPLFS